MRIVDLRGLGERGLRDAASLLVEGFREAAPEAWPDLPSARDEVREALEDEKVCLAVVAEDGSVLGWVGAMPTYRGRVWELHPLVVRPDRQRKGIGAALVRALEEALRGRGAFTLYLGTDDEAGMTSLAGADLYDKPWQHIRDIKDLRGHPFGFYRKLGFEVVGVLPDANGPGKPDIFMAKRLRA